MLVSTVFFILSQIIVSIVILSLYQKTTCDKPLDTYLTIFVVRAGLVLPLLTYQYLTRPSFLQRQQQQQRELMERQMQNRYQLRLAAAATSSPPGETTTPIPPPQINSGDRNNNSVKEWCERLKTLLDLFGILWFIVGNYLIFTSDDCANLAGGLYYTIMAWVILSYVVILLPIILCACVIFCLPCVLVVLRLLNITDIPGMKNGGSKEEILNIPTYKYQSQDGNGSTETTTTTFQQPKKTRWTQRIINKFRKNNKDDIETKSYPPITIPCADDAMCSICLSEYETGDPICKLWCDHHFHKDCVHEWLGLNSLCPLCKQDFRGKEHNDNGDTSNDPWASPSTV
ncbi:hypothetical protein BC941DRAFT_452545 [Chlamydoabsidia padenii]|nr:hypothetical protein BC941DRAFT_452545 [Chlamydoabsidia padenii]